MLLDGTKVEGPAALREALLAQKEQFVRTTTAKLATYALGREIESFDAPAIRGIVRAAASGNYRWSSIILAIVKSVPFQMRMSGANASPTRSASAIARSLKKGRSHQEMPEHGGSINDSLHCLAFAACLR